MSSSLDTLDGAFFRGVGAPDAADAYRRWTAWRRKRPGASAEQKVRKVLELATGLNESAVRHFLRDRREHLSQETVDRFEKIAKAVGWKIEPRTRALGRVRAAAKTAHVAVVARIDDIPSDSFFMSLLRELDHGAAHRQLPMTFHAAPSADPTASIDRVLRLHPSAIVFIRMAPPARELERIRLRETAVALIHADRCRYPPPVLVNVVPDHRDMAAELSEWLLEHPSLGRSESPSARTVVMAGMADETGGSEFPPYDAKIPTGIRTERRAIMKQVLEKHGLEEQFVQDYSFVRAAEVWLKHRAADAYVCLADSLAVGIADMLTAAGHPDARRRVVGFDASPLARAAGIASWDQQFESTASKALDPLEKWIKEAPQGPFPAMREELVAVHLTKSYAARRPAS